MTLPEFTSSLLNIARGSNISQSEKISERRLRDYIHSYRALLIRQRLNKGETIDDAWIQWLNCQELSIVDRAECPTGIPTSGHTVLKMDSVLPGVVKGSNSDGLLFAGTVDGKPYQISSSTRAYYNKYRPLTKCDAQVYPKGDYLYVTGKPGLKYISIGGIWDNPEDLYTYINSCSATVCYDINTDKYPVSIDMIPVITEMIFKNELGVELGMPSDKNNDERNLATPNALGVKNS